MPAHDPEVAALRQAVYELHRFIVTELDPDPMPVAYIADETAGRAAQRAVRYARNAARLRRKRWEAARGR